MEKPGVKETNALEMYIHPDGYYRCEKVSSLHMSWLCSKEIFEVFLTVLQDQMVKNLT